MDSKVTIIMATYNRAHFIVETLQSIKKQTYLNWECLIIDDGGNDNTHEVIDQILNEDLRFKFLKRPDTYQKGLPGCRNYGLDLAKGSRIIFFDDDDIVHPQNLELCVNELEKTEIFFCRYEREVFTGNFNYDFDYSKEYSSFFIDVNDLEKLLNNNLPFNSCAVMWKKECFANNRFVEHLMYAEEWELYSRILSSGIKGISIKKSLFYGRKHLQSNTGEFFAHNPIRRKSHCDAIVLVIKNLKERQLAKNSLIRYFVSTSLDYKEYDLFGQILKILNLPLTQEIKWQIYYRSYFLRSPIYKMKKNFKK
ncbi:glycosyltransferase [Flavobacterium resistens]|uniref:Glycosyltransferase n=1 Tax=Flavobacterium resistens TaxID=443612 RepID=A0ABW9Q4D7_9FLAO|nr:glycosyltransferase [Flavobacterium resistens]